MGGVQQSLILPRLQRMNEGIRLRVLLVIVPVHFVNRIARMGAGLAIFL